MGLIVDVVVDEVFVVEFNISKESTKG